MLNGIEIHSYKSSYDKGVSAKRISYTRLTSLLKKKFKQNIVLGKFINAYLNIEISLI